MACVTGHRVVEQRQDQSIKVALSQIGHRRAWAHIKIPQVRWKEMANYPRTRSLKFLAARSKVRPSSRYWVEVVGSRLSIFDSSDRVKELARLRLSDPEVERSSLGARRAEGWGDETSQDLTVNTADETQSNQGHPHHDVVIELWIRLQSGTELYRIAIDLSEHGLAAVPDRKSWVDAISVYISDKTQHRSGALLWHILAKRLKLVVELQKHFGDIHDLYGASSSGFEETIVPQYIRHPDSKISQAWDTLQLLLLLLVCYYVPLRTGFDVAVELWSYEFWQDAFIDLYFIADVIVQFRTAYWNASGVLVVDIRDIRRKYLKGWFLIDFVCVLPLGYVGYFVADSGKEGTGSFRAVKSLRLLRMGKMMRLTKVYKMVRKYDNSAEIRGYIGIFGLVFLVLLASHLLASFWFLIGSNDQVMSVDDGRGELIVLKGWVNQKAEEDPWWGERGLNASLTTRYVTSMYGIFNALENGFTDSEKAFAIFAELIVGSVIYGGLAAVLSAALMESKQDSEEFNKNYKSLKMWLKTRKVHTNYQRKVLAAYSHKFKDSTTFDEQHLLKELPPAMASNLLEKLYGQYLAEVPYFRDLDQVVIVRLAQAVKTLTAEKDSIIMEEGKTGKEMFILVEGEVVVEQQGTELGFFRRPGSFFGENPLIYWQDPDKQLRDRTVSAVTDSFLVFLELGEVVQVARRYPQLQAELMKFRRVGGTMRKQQNQSSSNGQRIDSVAHEPLVREADLTVQAVGPAVSLGMSPDAQNPHGDAYSPGVSTAELSTLIDRKFAMLRTVMVQQMQDEIRMNFERLESTLLSAMQDTGRAGGSDRSDDLVPRRHAARP